MTQSQVVTASVRIAAAPVDVFPYLTDASLLARWMGSDVEIEPQAGGIFSINVGAAIKGSFVAVEPPHRLVFTWGLPGNEALPAGASTVEILLTPDGDETVVDLIHRDLPEDLHADHLAGWVSLLDRLSSTVSTVSQN